MNMFDEARALCGMISMCGATQKEIAKKMGVSQSYVANKIRLLSFTPDIQGLICERELSERHARALLRLKNESAIIYAIEKITAMDLTVAATEALVDGMVIDEMPKSLAVGGYFEKLNNFENIINSSVKNLQSYGIKVKKSIDFSGNKRYITLCIEE